MNDDDDDKVSRKTKEEYTTNMCENQIDNITKTNNNIKTTRNSIDIEINSLANNNHNNKKQNLNCFKCVRDKKTKSFSNIVDSNRKQSLYNDKSKNDGAIKIIMNNNEYSKNNCIKVKNKSKNTFCSRFFSILQQLSCHDRSDRNRRDRSIDDKNSSSNEKKSYLNVSTSKK